MTPFARLRTWAGALGFGNFRPKQAAGKRGKGDAGEALAERFLRRKGYRILERNWRIPAAELDLVARDGACLVFVEVKSVHDGGVEPVDQMTPHKRRKLTEAAHAYLARTRGETPARFDVVTVDFRVRPPEIAHLENAFEASF